jgi:transcriptional regulator with XRE-family HTH domain
VRRVPAYPAEVVGETAGEMIREARLVAGLSQAVVAERAGIARSNLAAIESGARRPSAAMTLRVLDAIRGRALKPALQLSPPVLINIEVSRTAAFNVLADPDRAREALRVGLERLRVRADGKAGRWLDYWSDRLERWDVAEIVRLLLSTDPEDVEWRKVSPLGAILSDEEMEAALGRARQVWHATR